jgi:hypothetical protein
MISWLAYFIMSGSDSLIVARTTPTQSWTNPAERLMSVLNLALSNCALSRKAMGDEFEKNMKKCNSMTSVRKLAEKLDSFVETVVVAPVATAPTNDVLVRDDIVDDIVVAVATAPTNANSDATGMSRMLLLLLMFFIISFLMFFFRHGFRASRWFQ